MKGFTILVFALLTFMMFDMAYAQGLAQPAPLPAIAMGASAPAVLDDNPIEAPPAWLVEALKVVYKLPMIGPIVAKIFQWAGVISVLLTLLIGFLLTAANMLKLLSSWAGFDKAVIMLEAFKNSKFIYYLKFLSMFNAKSPPLASIK